MDWKKQFISMLFPLNRAELDIERAYLLKNKHLPKSIFKYREINNNSIKNLEEDTIWLADPSNFNDPYDCAHTVDFTRIQKHQESVDFERLMEVKGHELNLSDEQKSKLLESQAPFTILTEMLLSSIDTDKKEAFKAALSAMQRKLHQDLTRANSKSIASSFKLCSFSECNDSMLMWAHYASYHQGFCIEYDLQNIPYSDYRKRFLYPTIYSDEMFDATEHFIKGVNDETFNNLYLCLASLIKAKEWEYEKEWRLVFSNGIFDTEQTYQIGKPKMVYLGTKISEKDQQLLINICKNRNIPISKMKAHHSLFKLESTSLKEADQKFFKPKA